MGLLRALAQPSTPSTREIYIIYLPESTNILDRKACSRNKSLMGPDSEYMLGMRLTYARTLFEPVTQGLAPTISDLQEARDILEDVVRRTRRVFGTGHPDYPSREKRLQMVEVFLAANLKIAAGDPEGGIAMAREAFG